MAEKDAQAKIKDDVGEWLPFYPKGVPPKEALDAEGEFFRLAKSKPPEPKCFQSMFEEKPKRLKKFSGSSLKCCYGVSLYSKEESVVNAFDKFPEGAGDFYIAKGSLRAEHGKLMKTFSDPAHYTLWLKLENNIHKDFISGQRLSK